MKYIRTKDGRIIDVSTYNDAESTKAIQNLILGNEKYIYLYQGVEIDKYADTIDELCDEFVLDHPLFGDNCKCLYHSFEKAKNGIKKRSDNAHNLYDFNIYGAIWTEWGLKYVAKMDDKGCLKLL